MNKYVFGGAPDRRNFEPLPEADYPYTVKKASFPYYKNDHWILAVQLTIPPTGHIVFANPWSGIDKNGTARDGIAEFLVSCGCDPFQGEEPDWGKVIGSSGYCHLKIEIANLGAMAGKEVNKVGWFLPPEPKTRTNGLPSLKGNAVDDLPY